MMDQQQPPHPLALTEAYLELLKPYVGKLTDIQLDQLDIANHVLANLAVQLGIGQKPAAPVRYEPGQPVEVSIEVNGEQRWQKTTIVDRICWDNTDLSDIIYRYKTAVTGRDGDWIVDTRIRLRQS